MMADGPVVFLDSGIGGLSYITAARKMMPSEQFVYVADNRYFPYGDKDSAVVLRRVTELVGTCIDAYTPKAIVIACNTASVIALAELRRQYAVPFIGVVPAVKPAAENSKTRKIGIFATSRTVGDVYTENLIRQFAPDCSVISYPGAETVTYIEEHFFNDPPEKREGYIRGIARKFFRDGIDSLVLGCTHFVFLADRLQELLQGTVDVIDSRDGVIRQLKRVLSAAEGGQTAAAEENPADAGAGRTAGTANLYVTMEPERNSLFAILAERFEYRYRGVLSNGEGVH